LTSGKERKKSIEIAQPKEAAPEAPAPLCGYCRKTHTGQEWEGSGSLRWLEVDGYTMRSYEDHYKRQQSVEFDLRDVTALRPTKDESAPAGAVDFEIRHKTLTMLLPGSLGHCSAGDWLKHLSSAVNEGAITADNADDAAFLKLQRSQSMADRLKKDLPPRHARRAKPYLMRFARKRS
jgi:hypothetical protein